MLKVILANVLLLTMLMSQQAMADWLRVDSNDKLTVYADPATSRRKLNIVRISTLFDFKNELVSKEGKAYQSVMRETEFNCRENLQRMISYAMYAGKMGKGRVISSGNDAQDWQPVSRAGIAQRMKEFACSK